MERDEPGLASGEGLNLVLTGSSQFHHQGMKLEAVMEHLQRQQQARLQMVGRERKDREIRDAHIFYTQQLVAQQAGLVPAGARPSLGSLVTGLARPSASASTVPRASDKSSMDSEPEEDAFEGEEPASEAEEEEEEGDEEEEETVARGEADEDMDGEERDMDYLRGRAGAALLTPKPPPQANRPTSDPQSPSQGNSRALSPTHTHSKSPSGHYDWGYEEQFKQLYELDNDPNRKEFLDNLFAFMQKRGTPVNRIPIMAKQVLDLYMLYKLVTEKGGLVEVINKKIWREITKGLNLPTSITSAAFTLRTQYMKYLYPYECEKKSLSSPAELQAAIDSNRREGRRPSYSSALFGYPTSSGHTLLSTPKLHLSAMNIPAINGTHPSPGRQAIKKEEGAASSGSVPNRIHIPVSLAGHHSAAQAITLEQLREKLESGQPPEKKIARFAEEQHRIMQQALQQNLFAMATHMPMNIRINGKDDRQEIALNLSTNGISSINMSIEINGTVYTGVLFAQRPAMQVIAGPSSSSSGSLSTSSPTSGKGHTSAEPSTSGSP
uniref:AT-rich interactive domain-containing protein 3 n=1 Tax=Callorhinchus milii TaxID=7868 RepID=A0A4W3IG62_CALMI